MQTNLLSSGQSSSSTSSLGAAIGNGGAASEMFTKLLVAQIKNQNPLEPSDPSEFVNQLTQLSQMESLQALSQQTAASTAAMEGMQVLALGAQVGSQVVAVSEQLTLAAEPASGMLTLQNAAARTTLVLTGADGVEHKVQLGTHAPGEVAFTLDPAKLGLAPGRYTLRVDTDTQETPAVALAGVITSVRLSAGGGVVLQVDPLGDVAPAAITQFNGRPASATPSN